MCRDVNLKTLLATTAVIGCFLPAACSTDADDGADVTSAPSTTLVAPPADSTVTSTSAASREWILYEADQGHLLDIILVRRDGSDMHAVAPDVPGGDQTNPDWSPDGTRIVFAVTAEDRLDDLWTVDADGRNASMLLDCVEPCLFLDDPAWSPDGASIAYTRVADVDGSLTGTLETIDVATGNVEVRATGATSVFYAGARWSPDGSSIVAEVVELAGTTIDADLAGVTLAILDLDAPGQQFRPLTDPSLFAETADWSPDGEFIVYAAFPTAESEQKDLYLVRPDGSGLVRLTTLADEGATATHPSISRDASEVVFSGDGTQLMTVPTVGGAVTSATGDVVVRGQHSRLLQYVEST